VTSEAPFGGGVFIADTSAWARADRLPPDIAAEWERALVNDQIAACPPITLEILYMARDPAEFDVWATRLRALRRMAPIDGDAYWGALDAYREICGRDPRPNMPYPDILAAAAASARGWGVLHYDNHFDRLAGLAPLNFESRWIAPRGTID